jgi:hypothetical protein
LMGREGRGDATNSASPSTPLTTDISKILTQLIPGLHAPATLPPSRANTTRR